MAKKISVVLLSGGLDSCVAATMKAQELDTQVHLLSISYGQGAEDSEKLQSQLIADRLGELYSNVVEHFFLTIDGKARWNKLRDSEDAHKQVRGFVGWRTPYSGWHKAGYPSTRDESFSLIAAAGLEARLREYSEATHGEIVLATTKEDLTNFEDIEPIVYEKYLNEVLARKIMPREGKPMILYLPLIELMKYEVILKGVKIGAPIELTYSCYSGKPKNPCGSCDQCNWRAEAFKKAGIEDPFYQNSKK